MPRPRKFRRVCELPDNNLFGALGGPIILEEAIVMTVEEFESIRLMDYEGMVQEECADRMNVARTTVQRIYTDARKKVAEALVTGKILKIEGGDYELCNVNSCNSGCGRCRKKRFQSSHQTNVEQQEEQK